MFDLDFLRSELKLSPKRYRHSLGVEKSACELAERHFPLLDRNKVAAAAIFHDITKEYTLQQHLDICRKYGIPATPEENKLLHSKSGAAIAQNEYGFDEETAKAIFYHTTGKAAMTDLETIIYFADYIEENRTDEACVGVRNKYYTLLDQYPLQEALDRAVIYSIEVTIMHLLDEFKTIDMNTIEARNYLIKRIPQ